MRDGKGIPLRKHLERAAERGTASAVARLNGPRCPEALRYLLSWLYRMHGKSGVSMDGAVPLTPSTVLDFARAYDTAFEPWEIDLLIEADVALITAARTRE